MFLNCVALCSWRALNKAYNVYSHILADKPGQQSAGTNWDIVLEKERNYFMYYLMLNFEE